MPRTKRQAVPRRRRRQQKKRAVIAKRARGNIEYASAKQTIQLSDDEMNVVFRYDTLRLSVLDRLAAIAANYQYFRFTKVEMKFKPYSDTYIPGQVSLPATPSIPYFYWLINRGDLVDVNSFNALRDAGAKPIRFDEKTVTVSWKPSVLLLNQTSSAVPSTAYNLHRVSPWLSTNDKAGTNSPVWAANTTAHHGLLYGVEQDVTASQQYYYGVELTVHAEFKKPLNMPGGDRLEDMAPAVTKETIAKVSKTATPLPTVAGA